MRNGTGALSRQPTKICHRLLLVAPGQLAWEEEALAPLDEGEVEVTTVRSAVSVGSEYAWFVAAERENDLRPGSQRIFPRRMGYESLGIVTASRSQRAQVGDRVVATCGHRTGAVVPPADVLIRVPAEIPDEIALLSILSCEAARGVGQATCNPGEPVAITGAGALGLLALHRLRWLGFEDITVVEPQPERRKLAVALGARRTLGEDALPLAGAFAFALECSSVGPAFRVLQQSMRRSGSICMLADGNYGPLELDPLFHSNELTVRGCSDGSDYELYAGQLFRHWREHRPALGSLFDSYIRRELLIGEFLTMKTGRRPLKVMVSYGAGSD